MKKSVLLFCIFIIFQNLFSQNATSQQNDFVEKYQGTYVDKTGKTEYKIILKYLKNDICIVYSKNLYLPNAVNYINISKLIKSNPSSPAIRGGADKGGGGIETTIYFYNNELFSNITTTTSNFNYILREYDETIIRSKLIFFEKISNSTVNNGIEVSLQVGENMVVIDKLRLKQNEENTSEILLTMKQGTNVKILSIGKLEIIDNIESNWVQIEILEDTTDSEEKVIKKGFTGWCFGGYLE